ncbi:Hansenula MRAKII killer toxin-resistant protein 1 [Actinoplanes aureus]|uniref:Hansenula MRAKII killer toxin-resistant protein 1 n=1 Tax=Actinoplanes aureus TaxID=2792083 RepID=A0A931C6U6_9ACTN|nr:Hansenula MRAKII killer toxin-resistant protein 1 [Actinoplanes aureus]MBG0560538.1 Hansenula MRAKII killer toxin-resistant protein 1 [Actinoplanes aureus]
MADGWTTQASAAAGIAAGAGAAQLGLGYGLGVIAWPVTAAEAESVWLGSLGWATWITASATVLGTVIAGRLRPDPTGRWRGLWRFLLAASAALGALVSVALVALPARSAVRADTLSPQLVAGGYALAGLLAGLVIAFWAVSSVPVAANLIGTAVWLWALAITGVVVELATGRDLATYLTSWQFAESASLLRYGGIYWPSALLTLVAAFVIGLVAAWPIARRGELGLGTAISGAVGPLLVAFSFLLLAPQLTAAMGPLQSAYLIAPYAVLAGLGGSALAVTLEQSRRARSARTAQPDAPEAPGPVASATGIPTVDLTAGGKPGPAPASRPSPPATGESAPVKPAAPGPTEPVSGKATGRAAPRGKSPAEKPSNGESLLGLGKPDIADPPAPPARRGTAPKTTITPPPAEPTVARINPDDDQAKPPRP